MLPVQFIVRFFYTFTSMFIVRPNHFDRNYLSTGLFFANLPKKSSSFVSLAPQTLFITRFLPPSFSFTLILFKSTTLYTKMELIKNF